MVKSKNMKNRVFLKLLYFNYELTNCTEIIGNLKYK